MNRDDASLLDIVTACRKLTRYVDGRIEDDLESDEGLRYIVLYLIATIGEAAYRLSDDFRNTHPDIPWGDIRGMRNRVIHGYDQIRLPKVWRVATEDARQLIERLEPLLPPEPETA